MNIFRILASGKFGFREEFVTTFLAYLLTPQMDHGLGTEILKRFVGRLGEQLESKALAKLAMRLEPKLRSGLEDDLGSSVLLDLEVPYGVPGMNRSGAIDLVIKTDECFILIENKITLRSVTGGQLADQYAGFAKRLRLGNNGQCDSALGTDRPIILLYLLPAEPSGGQDFVEPSIAREELDKLEGLDPRDRAGFVTWQPVVEGSSLSFIQLLRDILEDDATGRISPLTYDLRQLLLAFIDFAMNDFTGFTYQRVTQRDTSERRSVADLLTAQEEPRFVGIRYGFAGLLERAWKNPGFKNETVPVSESERGWQYLPINEFKAVATWAMNPTPLTAELLKQVKWQGMPFWAGKLYLVAKAAGDGLWIGIQGGLPALEAMTPQQILDRKRWQIAGMVKGSRSNWFPGTEFCRVLESKGLHFQDVDRIDGGIESAERDSQL